MRIRSVISPVSMMAGSRGDNTEETCKCSSKGTEKFVIIIFGFGILLFKVKEYVDFSIEHTESTLKV